LGSSEDMLAWVLGHRRWRAQTTSSWVGKAVRHKDGRIGIVVEDDNTVAGGRQRHLTVNFKNGDIETIILNNVGANPADSKNWEWYSSSEGKPIWLGFGW